MADLAFRLNAEYDALKSFIALLEKEQQALAGGDADQLASLSDSKIRAAGELAGLAEARSRDLRALGAATAAGGTAAWLQDHAATLVPVWRGIQQMAGQARQLNHSNGILIQSRLRHNQQALTALQNAARKAGGLYGPDGQPQLPASGRALGSV